MIASTITELNSYIKTLLDRDESLKNIYAIGEVSNFKRHSSGHLYFSLKDENCIVKCMMFSSYTKCINFDIENGTKVFAYGSVSCYEPMGQYQFYVYHLSPAGVGQINNELQKLYKKLESEGLFDSSNKKKLKKIPRKIGIITSKTGAVIHDISSVLKRRYPLAELVVHSAKVQGLDSSQQIINSINSLKKYPEIDVIIIARGGGSTEDLWVFNNEQVVREIIKCDIPIISAVGHDVDYTLCDYAADVRASTPSVAAELASESVDYILNSIHNMKNRIKVQLNNKISELRLRVENSKNLLDKKKILSILSHKTNQLFDVSKKLNFIFLSILKSKELNLKSLKSKIIFYNPENLFRKGYTMAYRDNICIQNLKNIEENCELTLRFLDGFARFKVNNLKKEYIFEKKDI